VQEARGKSREPKHKEERQISKREKEGEKTELNKEHD
jgi:hypothetical protein